MTKSEFEQRRVAMVKVTRAMVTMAEDRLRKTSGSSAGPPAVPLGPLKVIDLVEILLKENPSLPVIIEVGLRKFLIATIKIDDDNRLCICG